MTVCVSKLGRAVTTSKLLPDYYITIYLFVCGLVIVALFEISIGCIDTVIHLVGLINGLIHLLNNYLYLTT